MNATTTILILGLTVACAAFALAAFSFMRRYTLARIAYVGEKHEREYWQGVARAALDDLQRVRADLEVPPHVAPLPLPPYGSGANAPRESTARLPVEVHAALFGGGD
jgi:hypothetical protein